jgi:RecA/RadA recombinase
MAEPAPPILGSALLMAELARQGNSRRAATGCTSIDAALEGGILYGDITSIAGAEDDCKSLVCTSTLSGS